MTVSGQIGEALPDVPPIGIFVWKDCPRRGVF